MEFFRRIRVEAFRRAIEEITPQRGARRALAEDVGGQSAIHGWIGAGRGDEPKAFVMGEVPSFADLVLVAHLLRARIMHGVDPKEWREIMEAAGRRWSRLMERAKGWVWGRYARLIGLSVVVG